MSSLVLIVSSLIIFPFLTYYLTSTLFFKRANDKSSAKAPPTIPYFVPGLFSTAGFAQLGARQYFAQLIKDYGAFAPFRVRAGRRSCVVVRDPTHVKRVLEAKEHLGVRAGRVELWGELFGSPDAEAHFLLSEVASRDEAADSGSRGDGFYFSDAAVAASADAYVGVLSANMHDKMFQYDSWTRIEDLWSFLQLVVVRCTVQTLFGSALLRQYPRLVRDYLDFNTAAEGFVPGMPRLLGSGAAKPRNRLLQGLGGWVPLGCGEREDEDETEGEGGVSTNDASWDEETGLRVVRRHIKHCHRMAKGKDEMRRATAAEVLAIIHTTNTQLVSATFWTTIETLRKPHLTRTMTATVGQSFSPPTHTYDLHRLTQDPFLQSLQTEVRRLRTASCVVRTNETNGFPLDKQWSLPKGATVAMFSHDMALNADAWKAVQPRALERPLEEFWAERFVAREPKSRYRVDKKENKETKREKEDMGALISQLTACSQFPGSRLLSAWQTATLGVLFAEFEMQLCEVEEVDGGLPGVGGFAFGTVRALDSVAVRVRKRRR